ncbi:MAG: tetratricopeptide repeat protein [Nitrospirae bacterium]|nr:MAG: tetratricopeptide repeat protein [Nitrospirota bacterium]
MKSGRHSGLVHGVTLLALGLVAAGLSACATTRLEFSVMVPAEVNLKAKGVRSLAVTAVDGPEDSEDKISALLTAKLAEGQFFTVVEREKLLALEQEQALGMLGVVDERMAAKAGKALGVDALLVGTVSAYAAKTEPYTRTVMQRRDTGQVRKNCYTVEKDGKKQQRCNDMPVYEEVPVEEHHHRRTGTVTASYRVVVADTAAVLTGREESASYLYDTAAASGPDKGESEILGLLTETVVTRFINQIQPHRVTVAREFENGGWLFGDADIKRGIDYVKADRLDEAVAQWESVTKHDPENPSAWYDLGIGYELGNQFDRAEQAYRTAERITAKDSYIQAVGGVRKASERHKKLQEQMGAPPAKPVSP